MVTEHFQEDIPMGIMEGTRGPCVSLLGAAICHHLILTERALIFWVTDWQLKRLGLLLTPRGLEDLPGWGGESHILGLCAGEGGLFENCCQTQTRRPLSLYVGGDGTGLERFPCNPATREGIPGSFYSPRKNSHCPGPRGSVSPQNSGRVSEDTALVAV